MSQVLNLAKRAHYARRTLELVYVLLSVRWRARGGSGQLIDISDVCARVWVQMVLWTETEDNILDQREAVISGGGGESQQERACARARGGDVPLRM